jgi:hypothetical protein
MKQLPFAVIYGGTLNPNVVLSSTNTIIAGTVTAINLAIAELNANFANYGYAATPALPTIPAIPTPGSLAPNGIAYLQSQVPGGVTCGPSTSYLLIDAFLSVGYADPSGDLDRLTSEQTVANLLIARAVLSTAAAVAITVQPTNQTIAHNAAGAIALTATGTGRTYEWYIQLLGTSAFQRVTDAGPFTTSATASLTITNPVLATYNGSKFICLVRSASGGQVLGSTVVTLTVS